MKSRIRNLNIELFNRKKYKKIEIKKILLKSIIQNKNNILKNKLFFTKSLDRTIKYGSISKQSDICFSTGRMKGIVSLLGLSRQSTKRFGLHNNLQNIRVGSW